MIRMMQVILFLLLSPYCLVSFQYKTTTSSPIAQNLKSNEKFQKLANLINQGTPYFNLSYMSAISLASNLWIATEQSDAKICIY